MLVKKLTKEIFTKVETQKDKDLSHKCKRSKLYVEPPYSTVFKRILNPVIGSTVLRESTPTTRYSRPVCIVGVGFGHLGSFTN